MQQTTLKISISGEEISLDPRMGQVSKLLKMLTEMDPDNTYELEDQSITKNDLLIIQDFYQRHNFQPPPTKVKSQDPTQVYPNETDRNLMMQFDVLNGEDLPKLVKAAEYIQTPEFQDLCIARIALEFYVDPKANNEETLQHFQGRFPDVPPITYKDVVQYRKDAPFLFEKNI